MFEWPTGVERCGNWLLAYGVLAVSGPHVSDKVMVPFNATWTTSAQEFSISQERDILIILFIQISFCSPQFLSNAWD